MTLTDKHRELLEKLYYNAKGEQGAFSAVRPLYLEAKKRDKSITYKLVREFLKSVTPYIRHKRVLRKFFRRSLLVLYPNHVWSMDLVFYLRDASVLNRQAKYCLTVYDCFSHYGFGKYLINKTPQEVLKKFQEIVAQAKALPKYLFVDQGKFLRNVGP